MVGENGRNFFGKNPEKVQELISLRRDKHLSYTAIGRHFGIDHSTVMYNIGRFAPELLGVKVFNQTPKEISNRRYLPKPKSKDTSTRPPRPSDKYAHLFEEKLNPGKNYKEYLRITRERERPVKEARMARLKAERDARRKRMGKISSRADRGFMQNDL